MGFRMVLRKHGKETMILLNLSYLSGRIFLRLIFQYAIEKMDPEKEEAIQKREKY